MKFYFLTFSKPLSSYIKLISWQLPSIFDLGNTICERKILRAKNRYKITLQEFKSLADILAEFEINFSWF
ncbi:hypothetical protein DTW91_00150 [Chryseobacterium sp. SC28]|nr:hypothetical protein DTW91_00150 [Chryseobacterium sp. SC28]